MGLSGVVPTSRPATSTPATPDFPLLPKHAVLSPNPPAPEGLCPGSTLCLKCPAPSVLPN